MTFLSRLKTFNDYPHLSASASQNATRPSLLYGIISYIPNAKKNKKKKNRLVANKKNIKSNKNIRQQIQNAGRFGKRLKAGTKRGKNILTT